MRSSVWHCTQFSRKMLSADPAGDALDPLGIGDLRGEILGFVQLEIARPRWPAITSTAPGSSDLVTHRADAQRVLPGFQPITREAVTPVLSLTTVMVMVAPVFLALTSTPSMGPSSAELTTPVSAGAQGVSLRKGDNSAAARPMAPISNRVFVRMNVSYFSGVSPGAPVFDEPRNSFLPSAKVTSRPLALLEPSLD